MPPYLGPLVLKGKLRYEAGPADVLLAAPGYHPMLGAQATLLTTTLLGGVTVGASAFRWKAAYGAGRSVALEIYGGASLLGSACAAYLVDAAGAAVTGGQTLATSPTAGALVLATGPALTLTDNAVYYVRYQPGAPGLTASLGKAGLVVY